MNLKMLAFAICTLGALATPVQARISRGALAREVESAGQAAMSTWQAAPGMGVCVVRRGERPIVASFGVADMATGRRVNDDTLFYYASFSKPITALALLQLNARGEIDIEAPLSALAPGVVLPEPLSMDRLTLRKLMTHTGGFENDALSIRTAYSGEHTPDDIWRLWSQFTTPLEEGEVYNYTNLGYVMSTYAVQRRYGVDWRTLAEREVLAPLRMRTAISRLDADNPPANLAMPHEWTGEGAIVSRVPLRKQTENMHAAGGHFSTVGDACRFVQVMVEGGRVGNRRVFPADVIASMTTPQVEMNQDFYQTHRDHYGFGWYLADYDGVRMAQAHGGFQGYRAHASFLPEHGVGVVVFTNENTPYGASQADFVANHLYDFLLERSDLASRDNARIELVRAERERATQMLGRMMQRVQIADGLALPNEAYVGTYRSDIGGTIRIGVRDGGLYAEHGLSAEGRIRPAGGHNAWVYFSQDRIPSDRASFSVDDAGRVASFAYQGITYARQ
jgi:CubicO group peptidase (beta-lactamase class C family)